ncbi:hypothetical protein N9X24_02715 [Rickettsiales bacterium]|nr:hypothetical protein [Rickettsiales bacterium]
MIIDRNNSYEKKLILKLKDNLNTEQIKLLNNLIISPDQLNSDREKEELNKKDKNDDDKESQKSQPFTRYKLTLLKRPSHSLKPGKIRESVEDFEVIKNLYQNIEPIIQGLDLNQKAIQYYGNWAVKAKVSKLTQFSNPYKRYLYLICFITHQYHYRQDLFVDIFSSSVQSAKNSANRSEKEEYFKNKNNRQKVLKLINGQNKTLKNLIIEARFVLLSNVISDKEKIKKSSDLLDLTEFYKNANDNNIVDNEDKDLQNIIDHELSSKSKKDEDYYNILESKSIKLQNKISPILKHLKFNSDYSNKDIITAIDYYQEREGNIVKHGKLPTEFLTENEKEVIYKDVDDDKPKLRISLYKSLLFFHISDAIKSGEVSLKYSYRYLSIEQYLIDKEFWQKNRKRLIIESGLENYKDMMWLPFSGQFFNH